MHSGRGPWKKSVHSGRWPQCTFCHEHSRVHTVHSRAQTVQLMVFMCLIVIVEINLSKFEPWLVWLVSMRYKSLFFMRYNRRSQRRSTVLAKKANRNCYCCIRKQVCAHHVHIVHTMCTLCTLCTLAEGLQGSLQTCCECFSSWLFRASCMHS